MDRTKLTLLLIEALKDVDGEIQHIRTVGFGDSDALGTLALNLRFAARRAELMRQMNMEGK